MSLVVRRALGALLAMAATAGMAWLSRAPYHPRGAEAALVRLAWSARPERVETCRRPTEKELAELPAHMREREVCEGSSARYRLEVALDGEVLLEETVRGAGLRHDRPLYLLRDLQAAPGRHQLAVRFERIDTIASSTAPGIGAATIGDSVAGALGDRSEREAEEHRRRRLESVPPLLVMAESVELRAGEVLLVTYQPEGRRLVMRGPS